VRPTHAHAPLPLAAFLFERAAVFTAAAEYIGDLRDKTGEHGLQNTITVADHTQKWTDHTRDTGMTIYCSGLSAYRPLSAFKTQEITGILKHDTSFVVHLFLVSNGA